MTFTFVDVNLPKLERETIDGVRYYKVKDGEELLRLASITSVTKKPILSLATTILFTRLSYTRGTGSNVRESRRLERVGGVPLTPTGKFARKFGEPGCLNELGCRYFGGNLTFRAEAGRTYYFQVGGMWGESGSLTFYLDLPPPPQVGFEFYQTLISSFPNPVKDSQENDYSAE
jgi:hypothetical protein